ncbi:MAG: DUF3347 domain-containing protein [Pedobacter sp.]|nr:MAG: DUF3347 domain-containing protein [Pedobacter sp.]
MKKIFFVVALLATIHIQLGVAQSTSKKSSFTALLTAYYDIKNALVNSDGVTANSKAAEFLKAINAIDMKALPPAEMNSFRSFQDKLSFDARHISETKEIAHQREHFANFSSNFFKLAKAVKITDQPIYYSYCPMKKSYWLSANAPIENPYYGKQMLTCGEVTETLNK